MATDKTRRGISFDPDDEEVLKALQDKLRPKLGAINVTDIVRIALRLLLQKETGIHEAKR
jgi:hypothetical protein